MSFSDLLNLRAVPSFFISSLIVPSSGESISSLISGPSNTEEWMMPLKIFAFFLSPQAIFTFSGLIKNTGFPASALSGKLLEDLKMLPFFKVSSSMPSILSIDLSGIKFPAPIKSAVNILSGWSYIWSGVPDLHYFSFIHNGNSV